MNLPIKIKWNNSETKKIEYIYNASGIKLQKKVTNGVTVSTTDYIDGFQYLNGVLQFFPHPEGYVKSTVVNGQNTYDYVYNYTDHLGNVRMTYAKDPQTGDLKILEENHYFPFGLKHKTYANVDRSISAINNETEKAIVGIDPNNQDQIMSSYKYKYNGKELQDELGLGLYDYGARNYDPAIGRFFNLDRLSEKYEAISPYGYVANNPIRFIDVNGEWIYITTTTGNKRNTYKYDNGDVYSEQTDDDGNKTWEKVDMSKSKDTDLQNSVDLLGKISSSGDTGKSMLDFFNQEGNDLNVFAGHRYDSGANTARFDKWLSKVGLPVGHGSGTYLLDADPWLILAHEIGHVYSRYLYGQDVNNRNWFNMSGPKSPNQAEILASHIENMIRAESGIPLRTYYGIETDQNGKNLYRGLL